MKPDDAKNLADLYSMAPIPWSRAQAALDSMQAQEHVPFLATVRPDGRPHVAAVGAMWDEDAMYVVSGPDTRKSRNLEQNPACVIAVALPGIVLELEGVARRVTDDATLQRVARRYNDVGWPARVEDGAFTHDYSAPSAGPPPWWVYEIRPRTVFGVLSGEPGGAMRWRFDDEGEEETA
jgi:hypothetical protein